MPSGRRHRDRRTGRRSLNLNPKPRLLVVCEGDKTERQYFEGFRIACGKPRRLVDIVCHRGGSPRSIVEQAIQLRDKAAKAARLQNDTTIAYDQVWCVYDVDDHPLGVCREAVLQADRAGLMSAVSNPSFELWLVLHFRESPGMQDRRRLHALVSEHVGSYGKAVRYEHFAAGYPDAERRAERLEGDAERSGEVMGNPTTGVYRLTRAIAKD